jgi:hypothetical protein
MKDEEVKPIKASEAVNITLKNAVKIYTIYNAISQQAESGCKCVSFFDVLILNETMMQLMNDGFSISKAKGMTGEDITIISWM